MAAPLSTAIASTMSFLEIQILTKKDLLPPSAASNSFTPFSNSFAQQRVEAINAEIEPLIEARIETEAARVVAV